jgi:hypothetical protein
MVKLQSSERRENALGKLANICFHEPFWAKNAQNAFA